MRAVKFLLLAGLLTVVTMPAMVEECHASKKDALVSSTIGENTRNNFGRMELDQKSTFDNSNNEILWFGEFKLFSASYTAGLKAEWYTPAGELFKAQNFTPFYWNNKFAWAKLDIQGPDKQVLELEGEWTVKVYWDNEFIDQKTFFIGKRGFAKAPAESLNAPAEDDLGTYDGHIELSRAFVKMKNYDKAIAHLKKAQQLNPKSAEAYILLGGVYNAVGQP